MSENRKNTTIKGEKIKILSAPKAVDLTNDNSFNAIKKQLAEQATKRIVYEGSKAHSKRTYDEPLAEVLCDSKLGSRVDLFGIDDSFKTIKKQLAEHATTRVMYEGSKAHLRRSYNELFVNSCDSKLGSGVGLFGSGINAHIKGTFTESPANANFDSKLGTGVPLFGAGINAHMKGTFTESPANAYFDSKVGSGGPLFGAGSKAHSRRSYDELFVNSCDSKLGSGVGLFGLGSKAHSRRSDDKPFAKISDGSKLGSGVGLFASGINAHMNMEGTYFDSKLGSGVRLFGAENIVTSVECIKNNIPYPAVLMPPPPPDPPNPN